MPQSHISLVTRRPMLGRYPHIIRLTHWVNAASIFILPMSGIAILLAHPRLYWGESGYFTDPAVLELPVPTLLFLSGPGRNLHFFAAWLLVLNGLLYVGHSLWSGHLRRNLVPVWSQLGLSRLREEVHHHLLRPVLQADQGYHTVQRLAYLGIIGVVMPAMILTGLTMSPGVIAALPWLPELLAGRQSARTLHFFIGYLLVLFVVVHVTQVVRARRVEPHRLQKLPSSGVTTALVVSRRRWLIGAGATAGIALISLVRWPLPVRATGLFGFSDSLTFWTQRLLSRHQPLAREFAVSEISVNFPAINTVDPEDETYQRQRAGGFVEWRLLVTGLVTRPTVFSLAELKALPARTQITQHSCEQGWSAIAQWTGVPLQVVLDHVGIGDRAKFIVFRCVDGWWDSLDLFDALHPQTLLAYGMNGHDLPVRHGAPVRLRVERQLGYKSLKYVSSLEVVVSVEHLGNGSGSGAAEAGYNWYTGI